MPHVIVKMFTGTPEAQKQILADRLAEVLRDILQCDDAYVSVGMEDVTPADWMDSVFAADIEAHPERIYKKPGYGRPD